MHPFDVGNIAQRSNAPVIAYVIAAINAIRRSVTLSRRYQLYPAVCVLRVGELVIFGLNDWSFATLESCVLSRRCRHHLSVKASTGPSERGAFLRPRRTFSDLLILYRVPVICFPFRDHFLDAGSLYFCLCLPIYNCSLRLSRISSQTQRKLC